MKSSKLSLRKDTLAELSTSDMHAVVGGQEVRETLPINQCLLSFYPCPAGSSPCEPTQWYCETAQIGIKTTTG